VWWIDACSVQSEQRVPVHLCKKGAALGWKWEVLIHKIFWVACLTSVV
jgi:hypothetical protein